MLIFEKMCLFENLKFSIGVCNYYSRARSINLASL